VKARWKVLLTDACHSGKVTTDSTALKINEKIENLPRGFLTLTSSRESELSYEDPALAGGAGVFTYFLVQGWQGQADTGPADGIVTADELIDYVRNEVRQYVRKQQARQTPSERGDFPNDLILGYSPKRRQQLAGSAAPVAAGVIVVEVNQENTEIYIDEQRTGVASPGKPLQVPGLSSGVHQIRAVRMGFEPATVEVNVVPGSTQTVSLRLLYPRKTKPSAQAAYEEAERIWLRSKSSPADLQRAADLYAKALKEDSSHSPSALGLCRILQQQGKTEEALKSCRRAVQLDPDYVEARTMTGVLALETGDAQEAVRQLQTASRQDARNATVQANFAEALYAADRAAEAEAAATAALQIDSALAYAYLIRAEARRAQKNFAGAADDYQRSIALEQFDSGVMRTIGFWAIGTGMTKNRSGYRALYRARRSDAYLGLCACETARDNLLRAASYCDKALALAPDDADAYVLLGQVYAGLFNRDNRKEDLLRAQSSLQKALQVNPALPQAPEIKRQLAEIREYLPRVR
jgi:tetratricopeptide (TPR) repeat protein